jgi:MFS family permease
MFGSRISVVAFPMLVMKLDNSPVVAGLVSCAAILPSLLVHIPAGVLVDRWKPLRVLMVSEIGRGFASAAIVLAVLLTDGRPSIWLLIPAMIAAEILEVFATLAEGRCASSIVDRDDVPRAQAYLQARVHMAVLGGRPAGIFLFLLAPVLPFLADTLSFTCSVLSLIAVRRAYDSLRGPPERLPMTRLLDELRDGFRELECDRHAAQTMALTAGTTLIAQALLMVFLAEAHAHQFPETAMGLVLAASGAGGVVGSAVAGRVPRLVHRCWPKIQMCACSAALAMLLAFGWRSSLAAIAVLGTFGFTGAIGNVTFTSYLVQTFPSRMLARVSSIGQVLAIGAMGLGPVLGGTAADRYDAVRAIRLLFGMAIFMLLVSIRNQEIRMSTGRRAVSSASRATVALGSTALWGTVLWGTLLWSTVLGSTALVGAARPGWVRAWLAPWRASLLRENDPNRRRSAGIQGALSQVVPDRPGPAGRARGGAVIHSSRASPIPPVPPALAARLPPGSRPWLAAWKKAGVRGGRSVTGYENGVCHDKIGSLEGRGYRAALQLAHASCGEQQGDRWHPKTASQGDSPRTSGSCASALACRATRLLSASAATSCGGLPSAMSSTTTG